jgi:hypothetical protein
MPVTQSGANLADDILTQLGEDFVIPSVDLAGSDYVLPDEAGNAFYEDVTRVNVNELTDGNVGGSGAFDKLMASNKAHLSEEYEKGRITGDQYSKAYIELTTAALTSSVQVVMGRDEAYWRAGLVQAQIRKAEIEAVTAAVQLEASKSQLAALFYQAQEAETRSVLIKMQVATEDAKYRLTAEQYNQAAFITQNMQQLQFEVATEERDQAVFTTEQLQPLQKSQLEQQVAQLEYTVSDLLPAQKLLVDEQGEAKRGETMDTRTDGTTDVVGMIGKQKALYDQQIDSYQKDASYKVGKLYSDSWMTRLTIDEATNTPDQYDTAEVGAVLATLRANVNLD